MKSRKAFWRWTPLGQVSEEEDLSRGGVKVFPGSGPDRRASKPHLHLDNPAPPWKLEGLGHTLALRVNPQLARTLTLRNVQTLRVGGGVGYVTTPHSPGALGSRAK